MVLSLLGTTVVLGALGAQKKVVYGPRVPLGVDLMRFDHACVVLRTSMSAGHFFDGLKRVETSQGWEFRKGSQPVDHFPDKVFIEVEGRIVNCSPKSSVRHVPGSPADLMNSLRFEAQWKRGPELRPVQIVSVEARRPPFEELKETWVYTVAIPGRDVPLTDSLVLYVLSQAGERVTRISARL